MIRTDKTMTKCEGAGPGQGGLGRPWQRVLGRGLLLALLGPLTVVGGAHAAEPPTAPQLRIEAGMHTAPIRRIATDAQGRWAVTASVDKTARVWDVASGRLLQVLRPPLGEGDEGKLFAVALSPDGAVVAAAGATGYTWDQQLCIYLFDRASGRLLRRLGGMPTSITQLAFSPDGRWLVAGLVQGGLRVWPWQRAGSAALVDADYGNMVRGLDFAPTSATSPARSTTLVTSSFDGQLRLYQWTGEPSGLLKPQRKAQAPGGKQPGGVAFSPDGRRLAVGYFDSTRVDVLEVTSLAWQFGPDTQGVEGRKLDTVAWSADGRTLVAGAFFVEGQSGSYLRLWPLAGRGQPKDIPTTSSVGVVDIRALPAHGTVDPSGLGRWLVAAFDPAWGLLAAEGGWQPLGQPPVADLRFSRGQKAFLLGPGARQVQFGFEAWGDAPHQFDLVRRSLEPGQLPEGQPPSTDGLAVDGWKNSPKTTLNGQPLKLGETEGSTSFAVQPDHRGFVLGTNRALRAFNADGQLRWSKAVTGVVWGVNIPTQAPAGEPTDGQLVVAAYADGTIRWHRISDGQELLAFFPHADRKRWVLWTPSGYYDASPGGEDLIGWHLNRGADAAADFFPASRFRDKFYRPDVIDRVLDTLDETQAVAQADAARGNTRPSAPVALAQALPPVVEVTSGTELRTSSPQLTIKVRASTAEDAPITAWRVRVNGQLQPEARGLGRQDAAGGSTAEREITVNLPPQDSEVRVFAENRHSSSTPATVRVTWAGAAPAAPAVPAQAAAPSPAGAAPQGASAGFQIQPKLYVLAVGVAQYQHPAIGKLGLPAKDAQDFAAALQRQKGRLYRDVEVKLLTDAQATADAVVDGLDWLQKQVTQHDVGIVFIAGHGVNDATQGYTFLPANADPERLRRTGVPMDEFKKTLANLPGKALFFFDTCHSGNVLGNTKARALPNDVSAVVNELASAENGVVVFSSSTGRQLSYEDPAWGNGAFTKALVEGLDGQADYRKNGRITHKMLDLYISERVKQLTGGKQSPVTQAPGGVPDYPVAVVK